VYNIKPLEARLARQKRQLKARPARAHILPTATMMVAPLSERCACLYGLLRTSLRTLGLSLAPPVEFKAPLRGPVFMAYDAPLFERWALV